MDAAVDAAAVVDGLRLSDWIASAGLSRSTAYELIRLLAIEPEARRVPSSRKPVSHLTAAHLEVLEPWAAELRRGTPLPQIRERLGRLQTVQDDTPGRSGIVPDAGAGQPGIVPADRPGQSQIVPVDQIAALAAALQPPAPPADPLRRARLLSDAAELGVALSSAELAEIVGLSTSTVRSWADGHSPRPGFVLRREKTSGDVWWTVERPGLSETVPAMPPAPAAGKRAPGFAVASLSPAIEAHATVLSRLELPRW